MSRFRSIIFSSLAILTICIFILSCDGGTRGTGVGSSGKIAIKGNIEGSNDLFRKVETSPIKGMIVVAETYKQNEFLEGISEVSDEFGNFTIFFEEIGDTIIFRFSTDGWDGEAELNSIPDSLESALIQFKVIERKLLISSVDYVTKPVVTPSSATDTKTPDPTVSPSFTNPTDKPSLIPAGSKTELPTLPGEQPSPQPTPGYTSAPTSAPANTPTSSPTIDSNLPPINQEPTATPTQLPPPSSVVICHKAGKKNQTLIVPISALDGHLAHGDTLGECQ